MDIVHTRHRPIDDGTVACPCHTERHTRRPRKHRELADRRKLNVRKSKKTVSTDLFGSQLKELCQENTDNLQALEEGSITYRRGDKILRHKDQKKT